MVTAKPTTPSESARFHRFQIDLHKRRLKAAQRAVAAEEDHIRHHTLALHRLEETVDG